MQSNGNHTLSGFARRRRISLELTARWQCDAKAAKDVEAVAFGARRVQAECQADRELGYELLTRFFIAISRRLDAAQKKILELYAKHE